MTAFEIVLLLCGIICVIASFIIGDSVKSGREESKMNDSALTESQKEDIRRQVTDIIDEEMQNASEKTEVSLDKISNTKILEMNEYADNILGEINRNHNEAVFLYDMLNDKAKEVKSTVKDVNTAKKQVEKMQAEVTSAETAEEAEEDGYDEKQIQEEAVSAKVQPEFRSMTPEIVREVDYPSEDTYYDTYDEDDTSGYDMVSAQELMAVSLMSGSALTQEKDDKAEKSGTAHANRNEEILQMYKQGMDSRDIAKKLNLGTGEVRLVIDLYKNTK